MSKNNQVWQISTVFRREKSAAMVLFAHIKGDRIYHPSDDSLRRLSEVIRKHYLYFHLCWYWEVDAYGWHIYRIMFWDEVCRAFALCISRK